MAKTTFWRRRRKAFIVTLLTAGIGALGASAADRVVNVFNWSDYIDPKALEDFTRETGIKVVYDTFDSNEILETRLLAGRTGYDVVVPSGTFLQRLIGAGVFLPLDKSKLPHAGGLSTDIEKRLSAHDPGNKFAVDYMWFTTGIAYNSAKIKERFGDQPMDTWDIVFKPALLAKAADCGVYFLDSPEDLVSIALAYLKIDPDTKKETDLRRAFDLLTGIRKYVRKFHSSEYINALANGDICLAVGWAGDSLQAANRAREANNGIEIAYAVPREGTLMSLDTLAIPKDAAHVDEAYAFIDYLMRPDIAARDTTVTNFANPIPDSIPLLPQEIANNPSVYPDAAVMARLFTVAPRDPVTQKIVTREWTRLKTGR